MDNLVRIEHKMIGTELVDAVNARELHVGLQIGRDFSTWIKQRLEETMAEEGKDYIVPSSEMAEFQRPKFGEYKKEYFITIDIAKHIAMLERTPIGREIRQYFIDAEKEQREQISIDPIISLRLKQMETEKRQRELERSCMNLEIEHRKQLELQLELQKQQIEQLTRISCLEDKTRSIEAKADAVLEQSGFYSILGYCNLVDRKVSIEEAAQLGRKATKVSKLLGMEIKDTKDQRFGTVHIYHKDVLCQVIK